MNISCLANSMASILSLCVHGRIPIRVVKNDSVSPCQINTNSTTASGQDEDKDFVVLVESFHQDLNLEKKEILIIQCSILKPFVSCSLLSLVLSIFKNYLSLLNSG